MSHQTAGLTRTGAIGRQLLCHGVSAVEQTVPVRRWRMPLQPQRRFDRSMGPSESQRAVPKPVRLVRPCCHERKKGSHRNRKGNEFRNGTGRDAVCSEPRTASATCADAVGRCRRRWCHIDGCVGRRALEVQEFVMNRFRVKSTRSYVSSIDHYLGAVPEAAQHASVLPGKVSTLLHARR